MTPDDAFDIASRFLDSGAKRNDLELAILRHMERHIAVEREACAALVEAEPVGLQADRAIRAHFAAKIRNRKN